MHAWMCTMILDMWVWKEKVIVSEGSLILEKFSLFLQSLKEGANPLQFFHKINAKNLKKIVFESYYDATTSLLQNLMASS